MKKPLILLLLALLTLAACSEAASEPAAESAQTTNRTQTTTEETNTEEAIYLPTVVASEPAETAPPVTSKLTVTDIAPIPASFPSNVRNEFARYTQVIPPNGRPITIYIQNRISDAQVIYARNTLLFFLTDVPGSTYGADKTAVANKMGDNEAVLLLMNGTHGESPESSLPGQPLHETEIAVPGSAGYMTNNFEANRDATFEEILHLVHDTGIGVDGANSSPGALPAFQQEIRTATNNAIANNFQIWPLGSNNGDNADWFNELSQENSLTQEYLAAVVDSYYGLWGPFTEENLGMWGLYVAQTRDDILSKDPQGAALMSSFFSPYLTYNAYLDPNLNGDFSMTFDPSTPYTHKSQYLLHATLSGSNHANLSGNDQNNQLGGNSGNNRLDGRDGLDIATYPNPFSSYTITQNGDGTLTVVGDGTDTLINIEQIQFSDQRIETAGLQPIEGGQTATTTTAVETESGSNATQNETEAAASPSNGQPLSIEALETLLLDRLNLDNVEALDDHFDGLSDEQFYALMIDVLNVGSPDEVDTILDNLLEEGDGNDNGDDNANNGGDESFGVNVTETAEVSNGRLTFQLQFMDQLNLPDGTSQPWSDAYQAPYIASAERWLQVLVGIEGRDSHTIAIQITVDRFTGGNGAAGPTTEQQIGNYTLATGGELIIGNHTYEAGFDQTEFHANILHELGHIIGIGSFTEAFTRQDSASNGPIFQSDLSNNGAEQYNALYGANVDFVPISDDMGHLYDNVLQEDRTRTLNGTPLPPLTQEVMANGTLLGPVTLGVLDDIGYDVDYNQADRYQP